MERSIWSVPYRAFLYGAFHMERSYNGAFHMEFSHDTKIVNGQMYVCVHMFHNCVDVGTD